MNSSNIERSAKKIPWLAGIFVAQIALAVVLFNTGEERGAAAVNQPLLAFDAAAVSKVELASATETLVLEKKGAQWQLGENLPAANERVTDLLKQIADLRTGWPVANTKEASKRFQVTDESFVRKIRLYQGDKELAMLYMGNAPSFRTAHVRAAGDEKIYSLKFDDYSVPTGRDAWVDPNLLRPKGEILAVQMGERKLSKSDGQWPGATAAATPAADGKPAEGKPPASAFDGAAFAKTLEEISVLGVAERQAEFDAPVTANPAAKDGKSLLKLAWTVTTSEGSYEYQLLGKQEEYFLRRSDNDHTFRVSKAQYDALLKIQELPASANS